MFEAKDQPQCADDSQQRRYCGVFPSLEAINDLADLTRFFGKRRFAQAQCFATRTELAPQFVRQSDIVSHDFQFSPNVSQTV